MNRFGQFWSRLQDYASLPCVVSDGHTSTYADLFAATSGWRQRLEELGVGKGAVVGLRADYSLASIAALLALASQRCVVALISSAGSVGEQLREAHADGLLEVATDSGHSFTRCATTAPHPLLQQLAASADAGLVIFSSGTSGHHKAALHSLERFLGKFARPGRRFRTLGFLLFDHVAGIDTLFYTLASGGCLVVTRRRDPDAICRLIDVAQVEVLPASPSFLRLLCLAGNADHYALNSLKVITYGSEPMDPATLRLLNARFPQAQISQKYGTTETGAPRSESRGRDSLWLRFKPGSVETRVVDDVLWLRGEGTILGYLNADMPLDRDGWYCTGDLVDVDGEWLRFRGRASELINVGGEKVAPAEVERVILGLDIVRSVVVSGQAHALMGQIVIAQVVLNREIDHKQAAALIRSQCRAQLAAHKVPIKIHFASGELTTQRHKVRRTPVST